MGIMSSNNRASLPGNKVAPQKFYGSRNGCMSRNCLKASKTKAIFFGTGRIYFKIFVFVNKHIYEYLVGNGRQSLSDQQK